MEVAPDRAKALALRWLLDAARKRTEPNMATRLAAELVAAKTVKVMLFVKRTKFIRWHKRTEHLLISAGSFRIYLK